MSRVVLIDGHSLLFRAYHALPKTFRTKEGKPGGAVYGFLTMLLRVVEDLKPDFLAVGFDESAPTLRHSQLLTYKEGRPEMEDDLKSQQPIVREILESFKIPVFSLPGYEGEDILATLVAKFKDREKQLKPSTRRVGESAGLEFYIVSGDRDVAQLVNSQVRFYMPKKGLSQAVIYDEKNVGEVFGVKANQVTDFKGLRGDSSDKIPGVYGIGDKTAVALIKKFGSVESVYKNLRKVKEEFGSVVESKLIEGAEQAVMSKRIAQIMDDVPISVEPEKLKFEGFLQKEGLDYLRSLGFRSILKRLGYALEIKEKKGLKGKAEALMDQISLF